MMNAINEARANVAAVAIEIAEMPICGRYAKVDADLMWCLRGKVETLAQAHQEVEDAQDTPRRGLGTVINAGPAFQAEK